MKIGRTAAQNRTLGVVLVCLAILMFACQDALAKFLFNSYPVPFVQAIRFATLLSLTILAFAPRMGRSLVQTRRFWLVTLRGIALAASSLLGGLALSRMPLAECIGIFYLSPFLLLILSHFLLAEEIRWFGWLSTLVGFCGLLVVTRPEANLPLAGVTFALASMVVGAIYPLLSRYLAKSETPEAMMFHLALVGTVLFGMQLPWSMPHMPVGGFDVLLLLGYGLISFTGHMLFTLAYRFGSVPLLTPFTYLHVVWATLLSSIVFKHSVTLMTAGGLALIVLAGVANAVFNHRNDGKAPAEGVTDP